MNPDLTNAEYKVLDLLGQAKISGPILRQKLKDSGLQIHKATFYRTLNRLAEKGLIASRAGDEVLDGFEVSLTYYELLPPGGEARNRQLAFYLQSATAKDLKNLGAILQRAWVVLQHFPVTWSVAQDRRNSA